MHMHSAEQCASATTIFGRLVFSITLLFSFSVLVLDYDRPLPLRARLSAGTSDVRRHITYTI